MKFGVNYLFRTLRNITMCLKTRVKIMNSSLIPRLSTKEGFIKMW